MIDFQYPESIKGRDVYVRMPIQNNSGDWMAADITLTGYRIDIETPTFDSSEYEACLAECREHNIIWWENWQVDRVISTSLAAQNYVSSEAISFKAFKQGALVGLAMILVVALYTFLA